MRFAQNNQQHLSNDVSTTAVNGKIKSCKRKGGWKFHDFSDESEAPGKRKRTYCHNRLETDILQVRYLQIFYRHRQQIGLKL